MSQISPQVLKLLEIPKIEQRTKEWYDMRETMITASDWASVFGKGGGSDGKKEIILKKCGKGKPFTGNIYTEWGIKYEPVASELYALRNNLQLYEFGVIRHPKYPYLGASPDGITPDGVMLEIKCPYSRKITGNIPHYYWIQIQGQLEVCDLDKCDYLECKFMEYNSLAEYLSDKITDKGCIVVYIDNDGNKSYEYSKMNITVDEYHKWCNQLKQSIPSNKRQIQITFWKLITYSILHIDRDREWFSNNLPVLTQTWNEIEHNRSCQKSDISNDQHDDNLLMEPTQSQFDSAFSNEQITGTYSDEYIDYQLICNSPNASLITEQSIIPDIPYESYDELITILPDILDNPNNPNNPNNPINPNNPNSPTLLPK